MKSSTPLTLYSNTTRTLTPIDFNPTFNTTSFYNEYRSYNTYLSLRFASPTFSEGNYNRIAQKDLVDESTLENFNFLRQSTIKSFFLPTIPWDIKLKFLIFTLELVKLFFELLNAILSAHLK